MEGKGWGADSDEDTLVRYPALPETQGRPTRRLSLFQAVFVSSGKSPGRVNLGGLLGVLDAPWLAGLG